MNEIESTIGIKMFRVGDEVECIDPNYKVEYGKIYTINKISVSKGLISLKGIEYKEDTPVYYNPNAFKLKRRNPFRVGDRIKCMITGIDLLEPGTKYIVNKTPNTTHVRLQGDFTDEDGEFYDSQHLFPIHYFKPIKRRLNKNRKPMTNVQSTGDIETPRKTTKGRKMNRYSEDFMRKLLEECKFKPDREVAREAGIHPTTLYNWRVRLGIPGKYSKDKEVEEAKKTTKRPVKEVKEKTSTLPVVSVQTDYMKELDITEHDIASDTAYYEMMQKRMQLEGKMRALKLDLKKLKVFLFKRITAIDEEIKIHEIELDELIEKTNR